MKLQYKLSNGKYVDVTAGSESQFLQAAVAFDQKYPDTYQGKLGLSSIDDAIEQLKSGRELRHGSDWYDQIRDGDVYEQKLAVARAKRDNDPNYSDAGWKLDCGHTVYWKSHIMNANTGSSCTDCYDKMS